jgi:Flp pilus assembly pilin Flp
LPTLARERLLLVLGRLGGQAQNVVEYGLLIATIALVVLLGTFAFGSAVVPWFAVLAGRITTVGT